MTADPVAALRKRLPRQGRLVDEVRMLVETDPRYRWLELGCSLGVGAGDALSDADVAIGYDYDASGDNPSLSGIDIVRQVGEVVDLLVHRAPDWPDGVYRAAAEYRDGTQLDLMLMPATLRRGLPDRTVALVDKDGRLSRPWIPDVRNAPGEDQIREWVFQGWWTLSAANKYAIRRSWFESSEELVEARRHALRLFATGVGVPYPSFGLVSLLDFEPYKLPDALAQTYPDPMHPPTVVGALHACATLLNDATDRVSARYGILLDRGLARATAARLVQRPERLD